MRRGLIKAHIQAVAGITQARRGKNRAGWPSQPKPPGCPYPNLLRRRRSRLTASRATSLR